MAELPVENVQPRNQERSTRESRFQPTSRSWSGWNQTENIHPMSVHTFICFVSSFDICSWKAKYYVTTNCLGWLQRANDRVQKK